MTNEYSRTAYPSRAFGVILRKLVEFKSPGLAVTVVAAWACRRHLSSLVVSRVHETLFFIRLFHLHSMFLRFSLFPWPTDSPLGVPFLPAAPSFLRVPQDFSGPRLVRSVSCSSRGYDESSDLSHLHNVEYSVGTAHIYYSSEIYNEERIAPLEKCRPNSI